MSIKTEVWGKSPDGKDVHKFTMTNAMGASVSVIEWGAICTSIIVPDAGGNMDDVALGFDSLEKYLGPHGCFGDTVGRYGNRTAETSDLQRISGTERRRKRSIRIPYPSTGFPRTARKTIPATWT